MKEQWDWDISEKCLSDTGALVEKHSIVNAPIVSADGEKLAIPCKVGEGEWILVVNEDKWPDTYERVWYPKFTCDGRLTALVQTDDEWTVGVDGKLWEEKFDFAWNTTISPNGKHIGVQIKREGQFYSIAINGIPWKNNYFSIREYVIDDQGNVAAPVQAKPLGEGDTVGFFNGVWSLALNDKTWSDTYVNVYHPVIGQDGKHAAAEVRLGICEYAIAQDNIPWDERFGCVWEPIYLPDGSLVAPVLAGGWTLVRDGKPFWKSTELATLAGRRKICTSPSPR